MSRTMDVVYSVLTYYYTQHNKQPNLLHLNCPLYQSLTFSSKIIFQHRQKSL